MLLKIQDLISNTTNTTFSKLTSTKYSKAMYMKTSRKSSPKPLLNTIPYNCHWEAHLGYLIEVKTTQKCR